MKLIKEFIIKEIILLAITLFIIEFLIIYIFLKRSSIIYDETFKETVDKITSKTVEASKKFEDFTKNYLAKYKKFEDFTKNYLAKYLGDLKLISMHSILFNVNKTNDKINLNNDDKNIYIATVEELSKIDELNKFINPEDTNY